MTEKAFEHYFVMNERDKAGNTVTFNVVEGEWGDIFWGYHHVAPGEFIDEVNRWLRHVGVDEESLLDRLVDGPAVKHLWARMKNDEEFEVVAWEDSPDIFPVTRLMT